MNVNPHDTPETRFYALERLCELKNEIVNSADVLTDYKQKVDEYLTVNKPAARENYRMLEKARGVILSLTDDVRHCLLEISEYDSAQFAGKLRTGIASFNLMTADYTRLVNTVKGFAAGLPSYETVNAAKIGRLMNTVKMGYYPTDEENITYILKGITFPKEVTTNLLDPCCGCGKALRKLATGNNCFTYGIELDAARREEAQSCLHRVGFGSFFHSRISNKAFHVIFLNPPYMPVITGEGRTRNERRFLTESLPYLTDNGLLIYIIPYYRMTRDVCRILCDNFADISIHRFTAGEFRKFRQIVVMGIMRKEKVNGAEQASLLADTVCIPESIPEITEIAEGRYTIPGTVKKVNIFKGSEFNVIELARQLKSSDSFTKMTVDPGISSDMSKRPPLPLSIAQVGPVGGSGLINGLVDCDCPHIIKGRMVKQRNITQEPNYNKERKLISTQVRETVSNKMIFNILTPDGFRSLR